jgi:FAD/FMN-containing dehydrogenase
MSDSFLNELRSSFDKAAVLTGSDIDARYFTDMAGRAAPKPRAVVRPKSTEEVSRLLKLCDRERVPVTTQGGMTGLVRATMPHEGEIVLSMERMNAIEEVDASSGVAIVQAGTILQKLQERVEQDGFMFPLDLGARGSCSIGGNISTNAGGNRVIRYGMTRDLVLGLEVVRADGTVLNGLRKYIKNNTGIDLKQLFVGTEGILGVVTRAALRIFPAPAEQQVALCALDSFPKVMLFEASGSDADRLRADHEKLLEEAMNEGLLIDATISTSRASAAAIWRIRDSSVELGRTFGTISRIGLDVSLAIDRMEEYALTVRSRIKELDPNAFAIIMGHAGDGNLHVTAYHADTPDKHDDMERLLYGLTREFDGSVSAEHGIGILKRPYLKLSRTEAELETMRMLKRALDPHNILNPGRVFTV